MAQRRLRTFFSLLAAASACLLSLPAAGQVGGHSSFIVGPIDSGPDATRQCLECHRQQADDVMHTTHWTWELEQQVAGRTVRRGKKDAINNFCTSVAADWPRCTSCHIGYGWEDASFDFSDKTRVDCLVCHDTTGTYAKEATGAGYPRKNVDLLHVAQNVGKPVRDNCGACHFFGGGGGDAVKHGDLDSSMAYPSRGLDVHMDAEGHDFQCQTCHETKSHRIPGNSLGVSPGGRSHFDCTKCHDAAPHNESRLNRHARSVACQSCHIPFYARELPTKLAWDWSTAGQDLEETVDEYGKHTYLKKKGTFKWGKMVQPEYAWYRGEAAVYLPGDKMDPRTVTRLAYPLGSREGQDARITPFKVHRGKQIYDTQQNIFITAKVFGKGGYWKDFDWHQAARLGMEASPAMLARGLKYSGTYGFAPTEMYWKLNHMVSPKEQALRCLDCHGDNGRMRWKELGYRGDPMDNPKWSRSL